MQDSLKLVTIVYDGTDFPEIVTATIQGLTLDADYSFFITGLNPFEGNQCDAHLYGRSEHGGEFGNTKCGLSGCGCCDWFFAGKKRFVGLACGMQKPAQRTVHRPSVTSQEH